MDLIPFLIWLTTAGGYSAALSFVAERNSAFQSLTPRKKSLVHLVGSLAIALAAYLVLTYAPAPALEHLKGPFMLVSGIAGSWIANQVAHGADPAAKSMASTNLQPFILTTAGDHQDGPREGT